MPQKIDYRTWQKVRAQRNFNILGHILCQTWLDNYFNLAQQKRRKIIKNCSKDQKLNKISYACVKISQLRVKLMFLLNELFCIKFDKKNVLIRLLVV